MTQVRQACVLDSYKAGLEIWLSLIVYVEVNKHPLTPSLLTCVSGQTDFI